jgi:chaperonin GroEL
MKNAQRVRVERVRNHGRGKGLNAAGGRVRDLPGQGVVDPVKTTRSALQNASSIASMVLTTEALISEKPEKKSAGGGGGMDDYDM